MGILVFPVRVVKRKIQTQGFTNLSPKFPMVERSVLVILFWVSSWSRSPVMIVKMQPGTS